jgi:glutathione-independent formaldehyde dehydrogenase
MRAIKFVIDAKSRHCYDRIRIAKALSSTVIPLFHAPEGYADFDRGVARKFIIDPHGLLGAKS